jgi:hypothetical protein
MRRKQHVLLEVVQHGRGDEPLHSEAQPDGQSALAAPPPPSGQAPAGDEPVRCKAQPSGQGPVLPVPKPVNGQYPPRSKTRTPLPNGGDVPVLTKAQRTRKNEVEKWIARVIYHGGCIVASYRLPSGDVVDFIDRSSLTGEPDPLASLPLRPRELVLPPGVERPPNELDEAPETRAMVVKATPFTRPDFWHYISGETDATSIEDYLDRYTVGSRPW